MQMTYYGGMSKYIGSNIRKTPFDITSNQVVNTRGLNLGSREMGEIKTGT